MNGLYPQSPRKIIKSMTCIDDKINILVVGSFDLGPLGRHSISFIELLSQDLRNIIYIDVRLHVCQHSQEYLEIILKKENCFLASDLNFDFEYDFAIFTHVIANGGDQPAKLYSNYDYLKFKERKGIIKICYPVWDGSVLPLYWLDIINNEFDICLTPSRYCAHVAKRHGVKIDCFGLHCLVLVDELLKIPRQDRKPAHKFRFGAIGISDYRKNAHTLIESFAQIFSKRDNVELFLHIKPCADSIYSKKFDDAYKKHKDQCNLILSTEYVSHEKMIEIMCSFDAYVFPQTTTGYFTTLAEAFAIGMPVIASDIPPHLEILDYIPEENNLFLIKHDIIEPSFHWVFDYVPLGCKFNTTVEAISQKMLEVYKKSNDLYEKSLIDQRRKAGSAVSIKGLKKNWQQVVRPINVIVDNITQDIREENYYMSQTLLNKYKKIRVLKNNYNVLASKLTSLDPRKEKYWYEDTKECKLIEDFSIQSQINYIELINRRERNYFGNLERALLTELKELLSIGRDIFSDRRKLISLISKSRKKIIRKIKTKFLRIIFSS